MANNKFDDDATQYIENTNNVHRKVEEPKEKIIDTPVPDSYKEDSKKKKKSSLAKAASSTGVGILIGGIAGVTMGMKSPDGMNTEESPEESPNHSDVLSNPELVDDQVMVATGITEDMSFGEAFAAARAEVGPGGVFEWHGNLYGTYTADEWNAMSAEDKAEYNNHFAWNNIDVSESDVHGEYAQGSDEITPEVVEPDVIEASVTEGLPLAQESYDPMPDPMIEVLGVVQDPDSGMIYGGVEIDGLPAILVDIEGDGVFDAIVADFDGNGNITENEIGDISDENITVNDLLNSMPDSPDHLAGYDAPMNDDAMTFDA